MQDYTIWINFMHLTVKKTSTLQGKVSLPPSKSQSLRALFFALLARGETCITNLLVANDIRDAITVCKAFGATINTTRTTDETVDTILQSSGLPLQTEESAIHTGNSGLVTRFTLPLAGLRKNSCNPLLIDCGEQMRRRPVLPLLSAMKKLGLQHKFTGKTDYLPVEISGHLRGGTTEIDSHSSQYLSALLMTLPAAETDSKIIVRSLQAKSYIDMTTTWLKRLGIAFIKINAADDENTLHYFIPGRQQYKNFRITLSGDFSSASCLIVAAALTDSEVIFDGLDLNDPQGDKQIIPILQGMGADITLSANSLLVRGGKPLTGCRIDAANTPDLLPALAVLGTCASGQTKICHVAEARFKETDRIHSMAEGLARMGAAVTEYPDGLTLCKSRLSAASVKGYGDHRTVMALSVAGLLTRENHACTVIDDAESISKSFPEFVTVMQSLGANMKIGNFAETGITTS
jgi:3-phosphoshikimate 1-carboxyvinyltransferase